MGPLKKPTMIHAAKKKDNVTYPGTEKLNCRRAAPLSRKSFVGAGVAARAQGLKAGGELLLIKGMQQIAPN